MEDNIGKKKKWLPGLIIGLSVGLVLLLAVIGFFLFFSVGSTSRKLKKKVEAGDKFLTDLDYDNAILAYKEAIAIDPKNEKAYLNLADAYDKAIEKYVQNAEFQKAADCLSDAVRDMKTGFANTDSDKIKKRAEDFKEKKKELENESEEKSEVEKPKEKNTSETDNKDKEQASQTEETDEDKFNKQLTAAAKTFVELLNTDNPGMVDDNLKYVWNQSDLRYALIYLNDDDIPELVVDKPGYYEGVYYYNQGEVKEVFFGGYGAANVGYDYYERKDYISDLSRDWVEQDGGSVWTYSTNYCPVINSELKCYTIESNTWYSSDGTSNKDLGNKYYRDGKEISEKEYKEDMNSLDLGELGESLTLYNGVTRSEIIAQLNDIINSHQ